MIVYNYDADLEVSDTCVRRSLLSSVEFGSKTKYERFGERPYVGEKPGSPAPNPLNPALRI